MYSNQLHDEELEDPKAAQSKQPETSEQEKSRLSSSLRPNEGWPFLREFLV